MGKPGRPRKRGILVKEKRVARRRFLPLQKGIVVGRLIEAQNAGKKFNGAAVGRTLGVRRNAVSSVVKAFKAGLLMPPTQPAPAAAANLTAIQVRIKERRKLVKKEALKRTRADDDTVRPVHETQRDIRNALPPNLRPSHDATIGRDLRAEKVYWLSTVQTPCSGPEEKKIRTAYCTATPKKFPAKKFAQLRVVTDESQFNINNNHSRKEYRTRNMKPMQVKTLKFPDSVMIYVAFSKNYRSIVVHCPDGNDVDKDAVVYKTKALMVAGEKINLKSGVSATKRYTMAELNLLPKAAKLEWMELERRFNENRRSKGVNRFAHCHECLQKLKNDLNGADHLILEDNAKIHTACYTKLYREKLFLKFIPGHPADSADLNPCEHVFAWLKKNVSFRGAPTKAALIKMIQEEFRKIPQKVMDNWIDSYLTRMEACKKAKGDWVGERECRRPH